jgi:hypothetical protein
VKDIAPDWLRRVQRERERERGRPERAATPPPAAIAPEPPPKPNGARINGAHLNGAKDVARQRKVEDLNRFRRSQILRLLKHRRFPWPDDEQSRRYLQPLLDIGLDGPTAQRHCPWLSGDELDRMIGMADQTTTEWGKRSLGDRYEVTLEEKVNLGLRNIEAYDANRWQVQEAIRARRREKDAAGRRRKRHAARLAEEQERRARQMRAARPGANTKPIAEFSARHQRVYGRLEGKGWVTIAALVEVLLDHPDFVGVTKQSLRPAIHRIADDLVEGGLIESKIEPGPRGLNIRSLQQ